MAKKKQKKKVVLPNNTYPIKSHFLDSGSFTLRTQAMRWGEEHGRDMWEYYDQPEFYQYMANYAAFIKKYRIAIDYYANVDAIPNPDITYRNQKYLEKEFGLHPVPVVHFPCDLDEWLVKYIDEGYKFIALGSLVGNTKTVGCKKWLKDAFRIVCDTPDHMPKVKIHGFGVGRFDLLRKYPWFSTDSTTWTKVGAYGGVFMPKERGGKFRFDVSPYIIKVSEKSPVRFETGALHYTVLSQTIKDKFKRWLDEINIPLGSLDENDEMLEEGVLSWHVPRRIANLFFYEKFIKTLPKWPWPLEIKPPNGFTDLQKKKRC